METLVCFKNDLKPIFAAATLSYTDRVHCTSEHSFQNDKDNFDQLLGIDLSNEGMRKINSDYILNKGAGIFWFDNIIYNLRRGNTNFSNYVINLVNKVRKHWKEDSPELCVEALEYLLRKGISKIKEDTHPLIAEFKRRAREVTEELNAIKQFISPKLVDGMVVIDITTQYHIEDDLAHFLSIKNPHRQIVVNNFGLDPVKTVVYGKEGIKEYKWTDFGPNTKLTQWC